MEAREDQAMEVAKIMGGCTAEPYGDILKLVNHGPVDISIGGYWKK